MPMGMLAGGKETIPNYWLEKWVIRGPSLKLLFISLPDILAMVTSHCDS